MNENIKAECLCMIADSFVKSNEKPLGETPLLLEYTKVDYSKIKKILIIQFTAFGDVAITTRLADALKEKFQTYILTLSSYTGIFEGIEVMTAESSTLQSGDSSEIYKLFENLTARINAEKFDLIINLHPSRYSAYFCRILKSAFFLGQIYDFNRKSIAAYWDYSYYYRFFGEYYRQLNRDTKINVSLPLQDMYLSQLPRKFFSGKEVRPTRDFSKKKRIVLTPGGKWESKLWPREHYIELINKISEYSAEIKIALTGDASEKNLLESIYERCNKKDNIEIFPGNLSTQELKNIISESALLISGDTSVVHIAANVLTPAIVFISSTITCPACDSIVIFADNKCRGCLKPKCPTGSNCIRKIMPETPLYFVKCFLDTNFNFNSVIKKNLDTENSSHEIFYSLGNSRALNFLRPVSIKPKTKINTQFDLLYLCAVYALIVCMEYEGEDTIKSSAAEIAGILSDYYCFENIRDSESQKKIIESVFFEINGISEKLNNLLKSVIRIEMKNLEKIFGIIDDFEKSMTASKIYSYLIKPFDVIMYEPPEYEEEIQKLLAKLKLSVKIKKRFSDVIKRLYGETLKLILKKNETEPNI